MPEATASAVPNSHLAALTFFAKSHPTDCCGQNGLPLLPNSITILGRAQKLKSIQHPNLSEYLDVLKGKHERTVIVAEYYGEGLNPSTRYSIEVILRIVYQIADGLDCMYQNKIYAHYNLEPANILIDVEDFNVKLFNYGLYYMTDSGKCVSYPIGNVRYMSPERLLGAGENIKGDVWSLGIIAVELLFGQTLWKTLKIGQIIRKVLTLIGISNVFEKIAREHDCLEIYETLDPNVRELIASFLNVSPAKRPLPEEILKNTLFQASPETFKWKKRSKKLSLLEQCPLKQIYYWWQLAGGDVLSELKKEGLIRSEAPILSIPKLVLLDGKATAPPKSQSCLYDNRIIMLSLANLIERLSKVPKRAFFPLIHTPRFRENFGASMQNLPLVIREKDTEYQFYRVILFERLLKGYPFTRDQIVLEATIDIPPPLRGKVWACLLGVIRNGQYEKIDKITPTQTDRQIDVDIPRCHQYDELLSSPTGHAKLKRILKAWVTSHPQYVYWQGLDSLTAPFLYLNFNDEELAYLSLFKFISKYLQFFFLKDNSVIIKEYLGKFSQLTAFHEPVLANHLNSINFIPELFAIPWFLTMFSHVFPLHKIIHLWDKLILGDNSYPLFIGISILKQLKSTLLQSGFNECILLFSDLPDIVMETCVIESQKMYEATPKSICYRKNVLHEPEKEPGMLDICDLELADIQGEICPRISANDLVRFLRENPTQVAILDIRSSVDFSRQRIRSSINIPFTSVKLGEMSLDSLNIAGLEQLLANRIVIVVAAVHENAVLFSKHLVDLSVSRVCVLHKGFHILHVVSPSILISS